MSAQRGREPSVPLILFRETSNKGDGLWNTAWAGAPSLRAKPLSASNQATPRQAFALIRLGPHRKDHRQMTVALKSQVSFWSAMAKRLFSCATEAAHNGSILSSSGFSSRKIRQRASRARIVQDGLLQALVLPEARWKKPTGTTLQRNDSQTRLPKRSIIMLTPISSKGSSSLKILGKLRKAFHPEVLERIAAEIPKELTSHPVPEIGKLIAA